MVCQKLCTAGPKCPFYKWLKWSQRYHPADYHTIGFTHGYGFCGYCKKRCSEVKAKECYKKAKMYVAWTSSLTGVIGLTKEEVKETLVKNGYDPTKYEIRKMK